MAKAKAKIRKSASIRGKQSRQKPYLKSKGMPRKARRRAVRKGGVRVALPFLTAWGSASHRRGNKRRRELKRLLKI